MQSAETATAPPLAAALPMSRRVRRAECVVLIFFAYLAALGVVRSLGAAQLALLCTVPATLWGAWRCESSARRPWSKVLREWGCLSIIPVAYWSVGWFVAPPIEAWQSQWLSWDRMLLDGIGLRRLIECGGPILPSLLETVYLGLYAIPAASLGVVYALARRHTNTFLCILFLGTLGAYALLPLFPVVSPRIAFPGQDLPNFSGPARQINVWVLDRLDISTGVFPSGHVAVAFSSAFGLMAIFRHRRRIWVPAVLAAGLVYTATIYGRYHYSVDGLASIILAAAAWRVAQVWVADD